jgi:hypothetical protein
MPGVMKDRLWTLVAILVFCPSVFAKDACGTGSLPPAVASELRASFPDWKIVELGMLDSADQNIWRTQNPEQCPGIASGHFTGGGDEIAVTLVRTSQGKLHQQVLLFSKSTSSPHAILILAPTEVASISVIQKMNPGRYGNPESGESVTIERDSLALTALEKGTIQYYWKGRKFRSIITSD